MDIAHINNMRCFCSSLITVNQLQLTIVGELNATNTYTVHHLKLSSGEITETVFLNNTSWCSSILALCNVNFEHYNAVVELLDW